MQVTYLDAVAEHFSDHLTQKQIDALSDIARALGAPHC
jgi:hypothetical protein